MFKHVYFVFVGSFNIIKILLYLYVFMSFQEYRVYIYLKNIVYTFEIQRKI